MERNSLPPIILGVFLCSCLWWGYLAFNTRMEISNDAIGYEELGKLIYQNGFIPGYFERGPHREPVYPLLTAFAMHVEHATGVPYTRTMALTGMGILLLTQVLMYMLMRRLNIRTGICAVALAYFGISPAIANTAFSLYSEIAAYAFILGAVLASGGLWQSLRQNDLRKTILYGGLLGALLVCALLVKAVFEGVAPLYLLIFFAAALLNKTGLRSWVVGLLAALLMFYVPLTAYKRLNQRYNGEFAVTNRGAWILYGNVAQRLEPLTFKRFLIALAYVSGEGACESLFGKHECDTWSPQPVDAAGTGKFTQLLGQTHSTAQANAVLIELSKQKVLTNPLQYTLLTAVSGLKMFFWESTKIGFVTYPPWLAKLYDTKVFKNALRLVVSAVTMAAMLWTWVLCLRGRAPALLLCAGALSFLFISFYALFFVVPRDALPIASLYLISIAYCANLLYNGRHGT